MRFYIKKKWLLIILLIFTSYTVAGEALQSLAMMDVNDKQVSINIEQWQNKNGTRIYFVQSKTLPMLDIKIVFNAGAARDNKKAGIALLTNALLNEGAGSLTADQIAKRFDELGVQYSAEVARDMAFVEIRTLTDPAILSAALDLFGTIIKKPTFPQHALTLTKNQIATSLERQKKLPAALASKAAFKKMYADHPYGSPVDGDEQSLARISRADIVAFYKNFYVSSNAIIVMVGDIDRATAENISSQLFNALPVGKPAPDLPTLTKNYGAKHHITFDSTQTHIIMGTPTITRNHPDYVALYVANHLLGGSGLGSILMEEIREKRGLAYSAHSGFTAMNAPGPFMINLQTKNEQAEEALSVTHDTLQNLINNNLDDERFDSAKKQIIGQAPLVIADNASITDYVSALGFYNLPNSYFDDFISEVDALKKEDVTAIFSKYLRTDQLTTVTVGKASEKKP